MGLRDQDWSRIGAAGGGKVNLPQSLRKRKVRGDVDGENFFSASSSRKICRFTSLLREHDERLIGGGLEAELTNVGGRISRLRERAAQ
jgi:hypothetical protein